MSDLVRTRSLPVWMESIDEDDPIQGLTHPVKLLKHSTRRFIWKMSKLLKVNECKYGIAGQTCQILETYLSNSRAQRRNPGWRERLLSRIPLLICVSMWLSVKMQMGAGKLNSDVIRQVLVKYANYTIKDINDAESEVFQAIDFRVPLWPPAEIALMLSHEVGVTGIMLEGVASITSIAEYHRYDIQRQITYVVAKSTTPPQWQRTGNIRNCHLAAASVAACCQYMQYEGRNPLPELAIVTKTVAGYLQCIATLILHQIFFEEKEQRAAALIRAARANNQNPRKRKMGTSE